MVKSNLLLVTEALARNVCLDERTSGVPLRPRSQGSRERLPSFSWPSLGGGWLEKEEEGEYQFDRRRMVVMKKKMMMMMKDGWSPGPAGGKAT